MRIVSSSDLSVRLRTSDGSLPVNVVVERSAIDDYFRLSASTKHLRRDIIEFNLGAIEGLAIERYRRREYTTGQLSGTRYLQILLALADLQKTDLSLPPPPA